MIKNVIFDLGGVLLNLDLQRCFDEFKALGMDVDKVLKSSVSTYGTGATMCDGMAAIGVMDLYQVGKISTPDFFCEIQKQCAPETTVEQVMSAWNSWLLDIPRYKLDLIKDLKRRGYNVYMLSNTNDAHWKKIEKDNFLEPVSNYFDDIFLSQELGLAKPDERIYLEVLKRISKGQGQNVKPEECLFVDDSQINCDVANALGIKAIKYEIGSELKVDMHL